MAAVTVSPAPEQAADLLQKMSLDSQPKALDEPVANKKTNTAKYATGGGVKGVPNALLGRSTPPLHHDYVDPSTLCYHGYQPCFYGGPISEWDDYSRYVNSDGVELPPGGMYGDNGSLMYNGYGYPTYGPSYHPPGSPVPPMGHDGQLYGPQHYQYPGSFYQQSSQPNAPNQVPSSQAEVSISVSAAQLPVSVENVNGTANGIANGKSNGNSKTQTSVRPSHSSLPANSNSSYGREIMPGGGPSSYHDYRFGHDGLRSPAAWVDGPAYSDEQAKPITSASLSVSSSASSNSNNISSVRSQNFRPTGHHMAFHPPTPASAMGQVPGYFSRYYPNKRFYNFDSTLRTMPGFISNGYDFRANGRSSWVVGDRKYNRFRGRGNFYGNENCDGMDEKHRGPRSDVKNLKVLGSNLTSAVKAESVSPNGNSVEIGNPPDKEEFNKDDFPLKYSEAKFFVIKSYSEDDVHKSIKYNVWASTPNGNKKLDAAYQEAKERSGDCPIFLFFSVNTSGQFVGIAEMVGSVDFNKTVEYWQQDKWNGCFPLKWHIIKDVPNNLLKHITLANNDNKPVTNSRDTQDINMEQGLEMLKIFKEHASKTSMLDDFGFYEGRQKLVQERKLTKQFQKQVSDVKPLESFVSENTKLQKPLENGNTLADRKLPENGIVLASDAGDLQKVAKPVLETMAAVANGC